MNRYCIPTPNQEVSESMDFSMQSDAEIVEMETRFRSSQEKPQTLYKAKETTRESFNSDMHRKPKMIVDIQQKPLNKSVEKTSINLDQSSKFLNMTHNTSIGRVSDYS